MPIATRRQRASLWFWETVLVWESRLYRLWMHLRRDERLRS